MEIPVIFCPQCDRLIWDALICDHCRWRRSYDDLRVGHLCGQGKIRRKIQPGPSSLVAIDDYVVVCDYRGGLWALDIVNNGKYLWPQPVHLLPDTIINGIAAWNRNVVVTVSNGSPGPVRDMKLALIDVPSGQETWAFPVHASSLSAPAIAGDVAFFAAAMEDSAVAFAVDLRARCVRWSQKISSWHRWPPLVMEQAVWFGLGTPQLQGFVLTDSDAPNKLPPLELGDSALFVAAGCQRDVFVVSDDHLLYRVDVETSKILHICCEAQAYTSPPSLEGYTLYIGALEEPQGLADLPGYSLHKYTTVHEEIQRLQSFSLNTKLSQYPLLVNDLVIVVDDEGILEIFDQCTDQRVVEVPTGLKICTQPVVQGDLVFLAGRQGDVQARYWRQPTRLPEAPSIYEKRAQWEIAGIGYTLLKDWPNAIRCFETANQPQRVQAIRHQATRIIIAVPEEDLLLLQRQLTEARENLRLIQERKAEYVLSTDIPLQLVKEERRLLDRIAELERQLAARPTRDGMANMPEQLPRILTPQPEKTIPVAEVERKATLSNQRVDFVLVTALAEERDAVLDKLPGCRKLPPTKDDILTYFQAELPLTFPGGETGAYQTIIVPLHKMGRVQAATATTEAITRWHPRYIVLVGIAGGMAAQGISIGDILIADQIVDYELQKITAQGPQIRWEVHRADPRLLNACHNLMDESWQKLVRVKRPGRSKPRRHTGPIASGDKVIAFGDVLEQYREVWPKLIGVEMEAAGVATAAFQSSEKPGFFMVRCVSDLADEHKDSADVGKWRSYVCDAAASFAIALLKSGPVHLLNEIT